MILGIWDRGEISDDVGDTVWDRGVISDDVGDM